MAHIFAAATIKRLPIERRVPCQRIVQGEGFGELGSFTKARTWTMEAVMKPAAALLDCQERTDIHPVGLLANTIGVGIFKSVLMAMYLWHGYSQFCDKFMDIDFEFIMCS